MRRLPRALVVAIALALSTLLLVQCGGDDDTSSATATTLLVTYGAQPTTSAKMICAAEAQTELAAALQEHITTVTTPTWTDHVYRCTYNFPTGSFTLSVKELPTIDATVDYYNAEKAKHPQATLLDLGQEGFVAKDATGIVRKDNKVLVVDVDKVPAQFGQPPQPRSGISAAIASVILGCWTGE
jgi:hypothetical protein